LTFAVSPGVTWNEYDLTLTVPGVAATPACMSGIMRWGPMFQRILLGAPNNLLQRYFEPSNLNGETWMAAYSYLAYATQLWFVRTGDVTGCTVSQVYSGAGNSFTGGNNVVLLSNTAGIIVGMKLFASNNTALSPFQSNGVYVTAVNSTSVSLTSAPSANAGNTTVIFRSNIFYSAVAQQSNVQNLSWAAYSPYNANNYTNLYGTFDPSILWVARYPGLIGNSIKVSVCESANQFQSVIDLGSSGNTYINSAAISITANVGSNSLLVTVTPANTANGTMVTAANTIAMNAANSISVGDLIETGNVNIGFEFLQVANVSSVTVSASNVASFTIGVTNPYTLIQNWSSNNIDRYWQFSNLLQIAPGQSSFQYNNGNTAAYDQMHIVVTDALGDFSGTPGTVLEVYKNVSRAKDNQNLNGTTNYYANVVNQQSSYVWWANDRTGAASANSAQLVSSTNLAPFSGQFVYGDDGLGEGNCSIGTIANGYSYFQDPEQVSVSLVITGKNLGTGLNANTQLSSYLINNLSSVRRDCVVFASPDIGSVVNQAGLEAENCVTARNYMPSSSYGFMDCGYKYMYDQWNNTYRWVPLNGDIAGLASQTDHTNAPWWSFAGFNRGNIKNVVSLAWNPSEADRDILYPNGINPVVQFPGLGTVLYGDKTLFAEPSAFQHINVRRLFIVLEVQIAAYAKFILFEFNDAFTRAQFVATVNPFLSQVQSQRGIIQYYVRCDSTNNTAQVIQNNQFVADIFIQPNYSINWVLLNFVNVPPSISFTEAESVQYGSA